jgi:hypothetical protein
VPDVGLLDRYRGIVQRSAMKAVHSDILSVTW